MPRPQRSNKPVFDPNSERVNDQIRIPRLMVIDQNNQNLGEMSNEDAKRLARDAGLDLVEVAAKSRPPVCRIMDYGKFKYEKGQKEKKQKSNSRSNKPKVIRLSPNIENHDIETKTNSAMKFLQSGEKVLLQLRYKGRANVHKEVGFKIIEQILEKTSELGSSQSPRLQGSVLSCLIEPHKSH